MMLREKYCHLPVAIDWNRCVTDNNAARTSETQLKHAQ
jgi:hypothetical protein